MCGFRFLFFFFSSRRRHTRSDRDWSSDVCSSDLPAWILPLSHRFVREDELADRRVPAGILGADGRLFDPGRLWIGVAEEGGFAKLFIAGPKSHAGLLGIAPHAPDDPPFGGRPGGPPGEAR